MKAAFFQLRMKYIKLLGRLMLWASDQLVHTFIRYNLQTHGEKLKKNIFSLNSVLLNSSEILPVYQELFDGLIYGQKTLQCVFTQSVSLQFLSNIVFVTLTVVCSHEKCFIKRFLAIVSLLLIFNTNKIDKNI